MSVDENAGAFEPAQKEYLSGFFAGLASSKRAPFFERPTEEPRAEPSVYGIALSDLSKEERVKFESNPLDIWDQIVACSQSDVLPEGADLFRFKFHGLFNVAPAQDAFMLRVRMPGNILTSAQLRGLAEMTLDWGGGYGDVTTRGSIQVRELPPKHVVRVLMKLHDLGLISRGSGADNVRNITVTPTAGIDPSEVYDVLPLARDLQFFLLNHREFYGLPRKFNITFDSGGSVSVVSDTNDIAFIARRTAQGVRMRVLLGGITGHGRFAQDSGIALAPHECVPVAAAMLRVFIEHGDRTNRKKARLMYLLERWGVERFLEETQTHLSFPLQRLAERECEPSVPVARHAHLGVHPQRQCGLSYIGISIPVGRMKAAAMLALADVAEIHGSGELRTTVWQNIIVPNVPSERVEAAQAMLRAAGFPIDVSAIRGGMVACTGNAGCKFSATATKAHAVALAEFLDARVVLDRPINIHLTGCAHSCAQHYIGDIGLLGVKTTVGDENVEAYNVLVGGGSDEDQAFARPLASAIPADELPTLIERMLVSYLAARAPDESFTEFVRLRNIDALRSIFAVGG